MSLKFELDSLEELDEATQALYVKDGENYRLDVEGDLPNKLKSVRQHADKADKRLAEMAEKFDGIDPDEHRQLKENADQVKELMEQIDKDKQAALLKDGKIDEFVNLKTDKLRQEYDNALAEKAGRVEELEEYVSKYHQQQVENAIQRAASEAGVSSTALQDVALRGSGKFNADDDGNVITEDGTTPAQWLESIRESTPHWYPTPNGAGQTGDKGATGVPQSWADCKTDAQKAAYLEAST